jgi:hypothetical protein
MTTPAPPLSPAAQAVLDAVLDETAPLSEQHQTRADAAAALIAAADQVVPEVVNPIGDEHDAARHEQWMRIRYKLFALATELRQEGRE